MQTNRTIGHALIAFCFIASPALAHKPQGKQTYSAGEPGNPKKPSRTIEVEMSEMEYAPHRIEVKRGEQIRFVIRNAGKEDHEFLLATTEENLEHTSLCFSDHPLTIGNQPLVAHRQIAEPRQDHVIVKGHRQQ